MKNFYFNKQPILLSLLSAWFLSACGALPTQQTSSQQDFEYVLTAKITSTDNQEQIAAAYGGKILSWHPEEGFAVVGSNQKRLELQASQNNGSVSSNKNSTASSVMALGTSTWSNGTSSWATGTSSWATGQVSKNIDNLNQRIWDLTRLPSAVARAASRGAGITIAVIDTGIDLKHPLFAGRLVAASDMYDFSNEDPEPKEVEGTGPFGHGTAVAGIIAQVVPNAKIMPLRVLDSSGYGDISNVIRAIEWARSRGAKVINLSLGSKVSDPLAKAIQAAAKSGIYVVIASGNDGKNSVGFPANLAKSLLWTKNITSVGASTLSDKRAKYSNVGTELKIFAPGDNIWSAYPENRQAAWSGTSMATPLVAAAFALGLSDDKKALEEMDDALNYGLPMPTDCLCLRILSNRLDFYKFTK